MIEKYGLKHVKGILLFGPPGTGKTLIARQLAKSLDAKTFTKVDGPEIFGKYVGES
jgi:vesicle-fusing ATPase